MQQTSHHSCAYFKINRFDELNSTKIRRLPWALSSLVLSDDSVCELLEGFSSLFGKRGESDLAEDDKSDSDDDQDSSEGGSYFEDNSIKLRLSDSKNVDDNTELTATELEFSDDSVFELLNELSLLFDEQGESSLGDEDEFCYQQAVYERRSLDNEEADAVIFYDHLQSCVAEDSLYLLDGVSTLFEEHRESEYSDFADAEERIMGMLGESNPEKQEPTVQSRPGASSIVIE